MCGLSREINSTGLAKSSLLKVSPKVNDFKGRTVSAFS